MNSLFQKSIDLRFRRASPWRAWTAVPLMLFLISCAKTGSDETTSAFSSLYSGIFSKPQCLNCHEPGGQAGLANLDFRTESAAFTDLKRTVESISSPSTCGNVKRVFDGDPSKSYLLGMLFSDYNTNNFAGSSGCQPPTSHLQNALGLSATDKANIVSWIQNGGSR